MGGSKMNKQINGETWWYVDTICDDTFVYDIYENEQGEIHYEIIDTLY